MKLVCVAGLLLISAVPLAGAAPVTGWVRTNGDAGFSGGSEATSSPATTDADADTIAANFSAPVTLADGDWIALSGSVSFDRALVGNQFRVGLFDVAAPVATGVGTGYQGIWAEAGTSSGGPVKSGAEGRSKPFETVNGLTTVLGTMSNPANTPAAHVVIHFSLTITRHGNNLDIAASFTDNASYNSSVNLQNKPVSHYTFAAAAFLMGGGLNATQAVYSDIEVTTGTNPGTPVDPIDPDAPGGIFGERLFGIDFNRADQFGSPSQSRYRIVSGSGANQASNQASYVKTIGPVQVTVSRPDGQPFEFRGANGDSSRAIPGGDLARSFLVADFIGTRGGRIDITISGLPAGDYVFRSYHLDPFTGSGFGFAQGTASTTRNTIEARFGGAAMASVQPTVLGSSGLATTFIDDPQIPILYFPFSHDGSGSLTLELHALESNGAGSFLLLDGFELFTKAEE